MTNKEQLLQTNQWDNLCMNLNLDLLQKYAEHILHILMPQLLKQTQQGNSNNGLNSLWFLSCYCLRLYHRVHPKDLYYSLIDMYPLYKAGSFWVYAILVLIAVFLDTVPVYNHHLLQMTV